LNGQAQPRAAGCQRCFPDGAGHDLLCRLCLLFVYYPCPDGAGCRL